jgi:heme/copper-type cytochrome/quinol oxidase subunit 4
MMIGGIALSKVGLVLAVIYIALAIWVVFTERTSSGGGGWISLNGMASYIITMPVSMPMEMLGARPDYQKTFDMAAAILICGVLVYFIGAGLEWFVRQLFGPGPDS